MRKKYYFFILILVSFKSNAQCWQNIQAGAAGQSLIIQTDGSIWSFGYGEGPRENDIPTNIDKPKLLSSESWLSSSSRTNTLAIKSDGTLWGYGTNSHGSMGTGNEDIFKTLTQLNPDKNWKSVCSASQYSVGLKSDGTIWSTGANDFGQLGLGLSTTTKINTWTQIGSDSNWAAISTFSSFTIALKTDGTLWAWGRNNTGQLGIGHLISKAIPIQIGTDTDWAIIAAGAAHSLAIKTNGTLWAWGSDSTGALGNGSNITKTSPYPVGTDTNWALIAAGDDFSVAIKKDGTLWAWGENSLGQSAVAETYDVSIPTQVGSDKDWTQIDAGLNHALALKKNNTLWGWGWNYYGSIGTLTDDYRFYIPRQINCPTTLQNKDFEFNSLKIYPNPVENVLHIKEQEGITIEEASIFDLSGRLIKKFKSNTHLDFPVNNLKSGTYLLVIKTDKNKQQSFKFIKK